MLIMQISSKIFPYAPPHSEYCPSVPAVALQSPMAKVSFLTPRWLTAFSFFHRLPLRETVPPHCPHPASLLFLTLCRPLLFQARGRLVIHYA